MCDRFGSVVETVDLVLAEAHGLAVSGPHFKVVHRFREPGSNCLPGEEIAWVLLVFRSRECVLGLPLSLRILFDYLARNRRLPQSAAQIAAGLHFDAFSLRHGANARSGAKLTRRFSHSVIKEYVKRLRRALKVALEEVGLKLDPDSVLRSEPTVSNEVRYRLKASVDWIHL